MRHRIAIVLVASLGVSVHALACRVLVKFPAHLTGSSPTWFQAYRVVTILEVNESLVTGRVTGQFGGKSEVGKTVTFHFIADEEPHAVCPTPFEVGGTYLVQSQGQGSTLNLSRFNWLNVPSSDEHFAVYVEDLKRASAANNALERERGQ